ncbi:MAG: hypothetical protein IKH04_00805 [Kiritimatiellae bacterium]|nr:hypothetical protein [Kiritimatiellia bacterium]
MEKKICHLPLLALALAVACVPAAIRAGEAETPEGRIGEALVAAWRNGDADDPEGVPMEGLSFPIDHFEDGTVRAQFSARWAILPSDESAFVRAKDVYIELYNEAGAVIGIYVADNCIFDRTTRVGYCDGPVRMEYKAPGRNIRLDGVGMQWNLATRDATILSEPKVTMSGIMGELGGAFR